MRHTIAALFVAGASVVPVGDYGTLEARRAADGVAVELRGTGGWKVNAEYPARLTVDGVVHGPDEAAWTGRAGGKAASVAWKVRTAATRATVKAVFCDASRCTPPTTATVPLP